MFMDVGLRGLLVVVVFVTSSGSAAKVLTRRSICTDDCENDHTRDRFNGVILFQDCPTSTYS